MRYVKGSHRWAQFAPRLLYSNEPVDDAAASYAPILPTDEEIFSQHEVLSWGCEPGDATQPQTLDPRTRTRAGRRLGSCCSHLCHAVEGSHGELHGHDGDAE